MSAQRGIAALIVLLAMPPAAILPALAQSVPEVRQTEQITPRPPESLTATPAMESARPPDRPEDLNASPPQPAPDPLAEPRTPTPEKQPDAAKRDQSAAPAPKADQQPVQPEPTGPPIPQTLRETDFDYAACLLSLTTIGTGYEEIAAISDPDQRDCGIARPVQIAAILPGVTLEGGAVMRCDTARALAMWTRDFVKPAARRLPGAPQLTGMQLGTTYQCRDRVGTSEETVKMSEHAYGNAIDISTFTFRNGDPIPVAPRQETGDLTESFQRAVRGSACLFFTTVLGPGSNAAHDNHLHLDVARRRNGWRLCE